MIKINSYYKLSNGFDLWMKIIDILHDDYKVECEIIYKKSEKACKYTTNIKKDFLDHRKNTGELLDLTDDEKILFEI